MAKDKYANFPDIYYKIPREFIEEGFKADKDYKLSRLVNKEINKLTGKDGVLSRVNHLITLLERIKLRVGN